MYEGEKTEFYHKYILKDKFLNLKGLAMCNILAYLLLRNIHLQIKPAAECFMET